MAARSISITMREEQSPPDRRRVIVALGGNVGDVAASFDAALAAIDALADTRVRKVSRYTESAPWGDTDQPGFLNAAAEIATALEPHALLDALKRIEAELGRVKTRRWGPRVIDLDIIIYADRRIADERLTIPHPRALERDFVMTPMREIAPDLAAWLEGG